MWILKQRNAFGMNCYSCIQEEDFYDLSDRVYRECRHATRERTGRPADTIQSPGSNEHGCPEIESTRDRNGQRRLCPARKLARSSPRYYACVLDVLVRPS